MANSGKFHEEVEERMMLRAKFEKDQEEIQHNILQAPETTCEYV